MATKSIHSFVHSHIDTIRIHRELTAIIPGRNSVTINSGGTWVATYRSGTLGAIFFRKARACSMKLRLFEQNEYIDKLTWVVLQLLKEMNIKFNPTVVSEAIKYHPKSPSLSTIVEVLQSWGIPCAAFEDSIEGFADVQYPSIAQLESNEFVLLLKSEKGTVCYLDPDKGKRGMPLDEFDRIWSGKII